jgi:hypothetical protein
MAYLGPRFLGRRVGLGRGGRLSFRLGRTGPILKVRIYSPAKLTKPSGPQPMDFGSRNAKEIYFRVYQCDRGLDRLSPPAHPSEGLAFRGGCLFRGIVHDKGRYRQHHEAVRLFDFKCSSGLAIPFWSSTIQSIPTRKRRFRIIAGQPRGRAEQAASAQARKSHR